MYGEDNETTNSWVPTWLRRRLGLADPEAAAEEKRVRQAAEAEEVIRQAMEAIERRDRPALASLLKKHAAPREVAGAPWGETGWSPFQVACQVGWRDGMLLLRPHADPTRSPTGNPAESPLRLAAPHGTAFLLGIIQGPVGASPCDFEAMDDAAALAALLPTDADRETWAVWCEAQTQRPQPRPPRGFSGRVIKI